jgi:hypothetical protein
MSEQQGFSFTNLDHAVALPVRNLVNALAKVKLPDAEEVAVLGRRGDSSDQIAFFKNLGAQLKESNAAISAAVAELVAAEESLCNDGNAGVAVAQAQPVRLMLESLLIEPGVFDALPKLDADTDSDSPEGKAMEVIMKGMSLQVPVIRSIKLLGLPGLGVSLLPNLVKSLDL